MECTECIYFDLIADRCVLHDECAYDNDCDFDVDSEVII